MSASHDATSGPYVSPSSSAPSSRVSSSVLLSSVWQLLLHVLIPASLANEAARQTHSAPSPHQPLQPQAVDADGALQCCDLVLVRTPGVVYRLFRGLASHSYDHLAIAMSPHSVLHVGPPTVRLLPASLLLQPRRQPLVLRPALSSEQRTALLQSLTPLIGQPYDTLRVMALIARLATAQTADKRRLRRQKLWEAQRALRHGTLQLRDGVGTLHPNSTPLNSSSTPASPSSLSSLICTDAILNRLLAVSPHFTESVERWRSLSDSSAHVLPLDFHTMNSWSINDVHRLASTNDLPSEQQNRNQFQPFFAVVQLSAQHDSSQRRPQGRGVHSWALSRIQSISIVSGTLLFVFLARLQMALRMMRKTWPRLIVVLTFTTTFARFLPPTFRAIVLMMAVLTVTKHVLQTLGDSRLPIPSHIRGKLLAVSALPRSRL